MTKLVLSFGAALLALSLTACERNHAENTFADHDMTNMANGTGMPPAASPTEVGPTAKEQVTAQTAAPSTVPSKPATAKPDPTPTTPPAATKVTAKPAAASETSAPADPACAPEHRAAGHC
nr:hypothetical protein [uncultured Sphingomonas sp.]